MGNEFKKLMEIIYILNFKILNIWNKIIMFGCLDMVQTWILML